jgi:hypothetical protein
VQPVASLFTDYAIPAPYINTKELPKTIFIAWLPHITLHKVLGEET